ncbi:MAG: prepilin-type N-terminal cleavage/methylation domain-containing protein [Myxococcota bacterium]
MTRARARGFTLIELVVAMTVALVVHTAASAALVQLDNFRRTSTARAQLQRDAQVALDWLRRDLYAAGSGASWGGTRGGVAGSELKPALMSLVSPRTTPLPSSLSVGFLILADVPRPDTNFDGISGVSDDAPDPAVVVPLNELSGRCNADTAACGGSRAGALDPGATCPGKGCPWSLRKYLEGQAVSLVFPSGKYLNATLKLLTAGAPNTMTLDTAMASADALRDPIPSGRLLQVDRIGYRVVGTELQRRQCWAAPEPEQPTFASDFLGCTAGSDDTGWMTVARNVDGAATTLTFFQDDGVTTTTDPGLVRSVEVNLQLATRVRVGSGTNGQPNTRPLTIRMTERMLLRSP